MNTEIKGKVYKYHELPEDVQEKVLERLYDINIDYEWWDLIYYDAEQIGVKIIEFDIDRYHIKTELDQDIDEVMHTIIKIHGKECDTFRTANRYLTDLIILINKHGGKNCDPDTISDDNYFDFEDDLEELEKEYKYELSQDYLSLLTKEYDYLTSEEGIIETIKSNEYEFTIDGKIS